MDRLLPFDELNVLSPIVADIFDRPPGERREFKDYIFDEILDILILSYIYGNEAANTMIGEEIGVDKAQLTASVDRKVAEKDWKQRVDEYMNSDTATAADIMRVAETDAHRIYNEAIADVGKTASGQGAKLTKTWLTMLDDRVRDTHDYLEGETIPFEDDFYTFDGDYAPYPGEFLFPENNVNCRCRIVLHKA